MARCAGLEKQKSRLQSEVEVLIIDLEKANATARELQKRVDQLERLNADLRSKLEELGALYEQAQRDLRNKSAEITRLTHELDKTREQKEQLIRENKKLSGKFVVSTQFPCPLTESLMYTIDFSHSDDLHETKAQLSELNRKYHELELECKRLENEREELSAAYKEAEAVSLANN